MNWTLSAGFDEQRYLAMRLTGRLPSAIKVSENFFPARETREASHRVG
jgi:hypothetical protein